MRERVRAAAPDRCGLAFERSEDLPPNWREAIPVVLEELTVRGKSVAPLPVERQLAACG